MDVAKALDQLRADVAGCDVVAFTDLSSKMVLCVSAAHKPAQEELDLLSDTALSILDGPFAEGANAVTGEPSLRVAVTMTANDVRVFLRSDNRENEALVCVCLPGTDIPSVVDCGQTTLRSIVSTN